MPEFVTDLDALGPLAEALQSAGRLRAIVACGGDGTVAEVVNRTSARRPVTVFPLGTANLLAGYFGSAATPQRWPACLRRARWCGSMPAWPTGGIFLLMAGCGFDADVVRRMHRRRRGGHISYWTWAQPILEAIRTLYLSDVRVVVSCWTCRGRNGAARNRRGSRALGLCRQLAGVCRRLERGARSAGQRRPVQCLHVPRRFALSWTEIRRPRVAAAPSATAGLPVPDGGAPAHRSRTSRCRISSMAIRAGCCRWRSRCCPAALTLLVPAAAATGTRSDSIRSASPREPEPMSNTRTVAESVPTRAGPASGCWSLPGPA